MLRQSLFAAVAAAILAAAVPASAQFTPVNGHGLTPTQTPFQGPVQGFAAPSPGPLSGTHVQTNNNLAAGIGNQAGQAVTTVRPAPGGSLANTNVLTNNNIAAGINNNAQQQTTDIAAPPASAGVRFDFSGRGPLVDTQVQTNTNLGAGIGNQAGQSVLGVR